MPVVVRPLWSADLELIDDGDRVAGWPACVCGVHLQAGPVVRTAGAAGTYPVQQRRRPAPSSAVRQDLAEGERRNRGA